MIKLVQQLPRNPYARPSWAAPDARGHTPYAAGWRLRAADALVARSVPLLIAAFGFFCFLPYPAIAVGNRTGVQAGNLLTLLLALPALFVSWRRRPFWVYLVLLAPLCFATVHVGLAGVGDVSLSLKLVIVWMVYTLTIVATQLVAPRYSLELLTGIALATLLHAAVGLLQLYSFSQSEFPLAWLYNNPAFLSVQENAENLARYNQRPFGIFPEPSAMSASLAPWVIFWASYLCGVVRLRRQPSRWQRRLFGAAAAGGLLLMIVSQSGHTAVALLALVPFAFVWFLRSRATFKSYLAIVAVFVVVTPLVFWLAASSLGNRLGGKSALGNSSWQDRTDSIKIGMELFADGGVGTVLFGMGPGMSAPAIQKVAGLDAVWSILLPYAYETGAVGMLALCVVGVYLSRLWATLRYDLTFAAVLFVWLVGVTITTSYMELLPLWVTLGWLTVWPQVCGEEMQNAE